MRVLLDENVDRRLKRAFDEPHEVSTVPERGWAGKKNGELLEAAGKELDALVTTDRGIPHQQNLPRFDLAVVVLEAKSNSYEDLTSLMDRTNAALADVVPGEAVRIRPGAFSPIIREPGVPSRKTRRYAEHEGCNVGRLIFLGTGDPLNGHRAQTSLAFPLTGDETMLIDASSGTVLLRQLEAAAIPLESVRHLFVTHRHFDHAGGLAPLLIAMIALPGASLTVHAPPRTLQALRELLALTIPGAEGWLGRRLAWRGLVPGGPVRAGDAVVTPFEVDHGLECVGFRVEQGGSIMAFAADTRPSPRVVEHARDVDLLVHEAYGTAEEAGRAHLLGHSTALEAGRVAHSAGVKRLVLTHLRAGRFVDPAALVEEARESFGGPVEAARDLDAFDF